MTNTELREKLVEIISSTKVIETYGGGKELFTMTLNKKLLDAVVDNLIARGVTFAEDTDVPTKWIPASEPPEDWKGEGGYLTNYYVYTPEYGTDIGNYMGAADCWLCMGVPCNVTHWMPLPSFPKEE